VARAVVHEMYFPHFQSVDRTGRREEWSGNELTDNRRRNKKGAEPSRGARPFFIPRWRRGAAATPEGLSVGGGIAQALVHAVDRHHHVLAGHSARARIRTI